MQTEVEVNGNSDTEEDDADVVFVNSAKTHKTSSPYLSARELAICEANPVVKAFLINRKTFDPSWTQAAESVFSDSHPFKQKRRNRSQEQPQTQKKELIPSRSSSESRCSSPKSRKKNEEATTKGKSEKKRKVESVKEGGESGKEKQKKEVVEAEKSPAKTRKLSVPSTAAEINESKTETPKSNDEKKIAPKKKRMSLAMSNGKNSAFINTERLINLKMKVESAIRDHKVYSMTGHYHSVRRALKQRGWVEKIDSDFKGTRRRRHRIEDADEAGLCITVRSEDARKDYTGEQCEAEIVNRMLRNITEDLCWLSKPYPYCWKDINKCDMVNRLPKAYFSNKVGLANSLVHMQWYYEPGVCSTQYPRTYNISLRDEYDAFQDDFRLTACVSTLKWLTNSYRQGGDAAVRSSEGRVDTNMVEFASRRCLDYVRCREHEDIDLEMPQVWDHQWEHFLTQFYKLVNDGNLLREAKEDPPVAVMVGNAQSVVNRLKPHWPQYDVEGINNWWIVKPGGRCCGNGILIRNHLDQIINIVSPSITRETRYVVQKYIERPLLIYNTKFDIRQWFLVTNVYPLTIWMYKESYLRFCSTTFTLKNTHESIHLCNNAVQRRYKNGKRDRNLPDENMWDCYTFQTYLKAIGHPDVWEDVIYPGMRESFVGALLASQDNMERRRNCFELYGADFMVSEQLTDGPWLIEINSNPAMDSSTSVTARMCPQVLEDIIKVVVDRRNDKNASTGSFELAFKQNCPPIPPYLGMSLSLRGKKCYKVQSDNRKMKRPSFQPSTTESDDSSSSEEENIVQKRCSTDFMQPIKTLRDEIRLLGQRRREDLLNVPHDGGSDSVDTDTSKGSPDRRIALEGKEIELKKKRRKRRKTGQNISKHQAEKKVLPMVKKEITVIPAKDAEKGKNIEALRGLNISKLYPKSEDEALGKHPENLEVYRDYIYSGQCLEEYKNNNKNYHEVIEALFRKEAKQLGVDGVENDVGNANSPIIIAGLWEPKGSSCDEERQRLVCPRLLKVETSRDKSKSPTRSDNSLNLDSDRNCSTSPGDQSDCDLAESGRSSLRSVSRGRNKDFETRFEKVLRRLEEKENSKLKWNEADFTTALSITTPDILVKERSKPSKWLSPKSSADYIKEWKYKIDETRKNCEDMLTKLRHFKDTNSKIKFQSILQTKLEEEARSLNELKTKQQLERNKNPRKVGENWEGKLSEVKMRDGRAVVKSVEERDRDGPLSISSATGAVLNVSDVLPKVRLRNRPNIPNAATGYSRNMDVKSLPSRKNSRKENSS